MRRQEQGFTLIELVIVIVILGILAAVAIPQYLDLSVQAKDAAASGAKASVGSALAIAAADKKATPTGTEVASKLPGSTCAGGSARIAGSGSNFVTVQLLGTAAAVNTDCASPAMSVGTATYVSV